MSGEPPFRLIGTPRFGGILVVVDHASNHVPDDIALGIAPRLLGQHMAVDIGTLGIAELLAQRPGFATFAATHSRRVCDLIRDEIIPAIIWMPQGARRGWRGFSGPITRRWQHCSTRCRRR